MLASTSDSAHDREHIYRVLHSALAIAKTEENVDYDILLAACLLHDVGRPEQFETPIYAMQRWEVRKPILFCCKTVLRKTLRLLSAAVF